MPSFRIFTCTPLRSRSKGRYNSITPILAILTNRHNEKLAYAPATYYDGKAAQYVKTKYPLRAATISLSLNALLAYSSTTGGPLKLVQ